MSQKLGRNIELLVNSSKFIQISDLDVEGVLNIHIDEGESRYSLTLEDGCSLSGIRILSSGVDVTTNPILDGMSFKIKSQTNLGSVLLHEDLNVSSQSSRIDIQGENLISLSLDERPREIYYDLSSSRWKIISPFQSNDYGSNKITNESTLSGSTLTEALGNISPYTIITGSQVWVSGTFQTIWSHSINEGVFGSIRVDDALAWSGTAATVTNSQFRYTNSYRRQTGGNAIVSTGLSNVQGNLAVAQQRLIASGTNIELQLSFNLNATIDYQFPVYLVEKQL